MNEPTEKQLVHDWITGELEIYEIEVPVVPKAEVAADDRQ